MARGDSYPKQIEIMLHASVSTLIRPEGSIKSGPKCGYVSMGGKFKTVINIILIGFHISLIAGHVNQKSVANSRFYANEIKEECLFDPEMKLLHAYFDNNDQFRAECLNEADLEGYLTSISETMLYFSLPEEDFACLPLRTFLATLLANVVFKPLLDMMSDPDFLNLQVARLVSGAVVLFSNQLE